MSELSIVEKQSEIAEGDFWIFIGMDEESIKAVFKEWLYRLAKRNDWLNDKDKIIIARIATYFQVSRQTATNWLLGTSCLSTQKVNAVIAPRMNITPAEFWYEMQLIDRELKGLDVDISIDKSSFTDKALDAEQLLGYIKALPTTEKSKLRKLYLTSIAEGTL